MLLLFIRGFICLDFVSVIVFHDRLLFSPGGFLTLSVLVGFRSDGNSLWVFYNILEGLLAGACLSFIGEDFHYCRKYLREYPLGRLAADEAFRVLLLAAAFLNGYFLTVYAKLEDGFKVTIESWPGGLAILALCVCFEFVYHYHRIWKYPQKANQRKWMD